MRALIIYSGQTRKMKAIVQAISSAIRKGRNDVDEVRVGRGERLNSYGFPHYQESIRSARFRKYAIQNSG